MPVTFKVNEVNPLPENLTLPRWDASEYFKRQNRGLVCPDSHSNHPPFLTLHKHENKFLSALLLAFDLHLPLSLRPQHFWMLVLQAVAKHVRDNAEKLRHKFVHHQDKMKILVHCDDFKVGVVGNDWARAINSFSGTIAKLTTEDTFRALSPNFSNTTKVEEVACQVTIMDMVQDFFSYEIGTRCGFPSITLEGTLEDWQTLRRDAEALIHDKCLPEFVAFWIPALIPVLDRFVHSFQNPSQTDTAFWSDMCKQIGEGRSSTHVATINGWINFFFPGFFFPRVPKTPAISYDQAPIGIGSAPVTWAYYGRTIHLEFRAGFVGVSQEADGTIKPEIGMFIVDTSKAQFKQA